MIRKYEMLIILPLMYSTNPMILNRELHALRGEKDPVKRKAINSFLL